MNNLLAGLNPQNFYLGTLCRREHRWKSTNQSLRYTKARNCVLCKATKNIGFLSQPLEVRFWSKVNKTNPNGCWIWLGTKDRKGYGKIHAHGKNGVLAHRVAWELTNGLIPNRLHILHHCDNPSCVNPAHLFLGTNADNVADKLKKGRQAQGETIAATRRGDNNVSRRYPERLVRGEASSLSKLTTEQVIQIISRYRTGGISQKALAKEYGITQSQVNRIVKGQNWKHIQL